VQHKGSIKARHIQLAVRSDDEFNEMFSRRTIGKHGIQPFKTDDPAEQFKECFRNTFFQIIRELETDPNAAAARTIQRMGKDCHHARDKWHWQYGDDARLDDDSEDDTGSSAEDNEEDTPEDEEMAGEMTEIQRGPEHRDPDPDLDYEKGGDTKRREDHNEKVATPTKRIDIYQHSRVKAQTKPEKCGDKHKDVDVESSCKHAGHDVLTGMAQGGGGNRLWPGQPGATSIDVNQEISVGSNNPLGGLALCRVLIAGLEQNGDKSMSFVALGFPKSQNTQCVPDHLFFYDCMTTLSSSDSEFILPSKRLHDFGSVS
jgi:hypothetical protein